MTSKKLSEMSEQVALVKEIERALEYRGVTRYRLAKLMGTTPAFITKCLKPHTNLTLRTILRIANALDAKVSIGLTAEPMCNIKSKTNKSATI